MFVDERNYKYQEYLETSKRVLAPEEEENLSICDHLCSFLINLPKQNEGNIPFIFIESSSGMGKTQMAFNLMTFSKGNANGLFNIFYILCSQVKDSSQTIYKAFAERTRLFLACVEADLKFNIDPNALECVNLAPRSLYTFGFILSALKRY